MGSSKCLRAGRWALTPTRKRMLRKLIPAKDSHLLYVDHTEDGDGLYKLVCQQDLEGVIMKPKESPYIFLSLP